MPAAPIYVETFIRGSLDEVWRLTQQPHLHQQWDLRFSGIEYLPRATGEEPQRFTYSTRIGFGLRIEGTGESVATKTKGDESTSVLKFGSASPLSLIREGSGYWKYRPEEDGVRFITGYTYTPRYGAVGKGIDLVFRPLIGWATAWSFDCLRLWIERGAQPALAVRLALVQFVSKTALALCWLYQGLVPKLLFPEGGELAVLQSTGLFPVQWTLYLLYALGVAEVAFGLWFLLGRGSRVLYLANIIILAGLALGGLAGMPHLFKAPFNPLSVSLGMVGLSLTGLYSLYGIPYAWRCKRKP